MSFLYRWRKQGKTAILSSAAKLVIAQTTLADDGVYECIPHNAIGDGKIGTVTLTILGEYCVISVKIRGQIKCSLT